MELRGKTAIVTGGSRGFGRGMVETLVAQGMRVLAVARHPETLARLKAEVNGAVETLAADATDTAVAMSTIQQERPQVLVLNAGALIPIQETRFHTWETFSLIWDTDVRGTFVWAREALLAPLEPGSTIIVVSSGAAEVASPITAGYIVGKAGQMALAKCLALEAQALGIRVHYLLPNLTSETDMGRQAIGNLARRFGVSEQTIMEQRNVKPGLTPKQVGEGVLQILTDPAYIETLGFRISGRGLEPIGEKEIAPA